jgi:YD repeat-containing protein
MLIGPLWLSAQEPGKYPSVNIVSPTASAIAKYVDFPVSLHTGVPQINIPIYTVTEGPLQLPITLSYHASGLRVNEPSSWVGAGWSLDAGGVISRTVKGIPDEKIESADNSYLGKSGYSNYILDPDGVLKYQALQNGQIDGEPDLFTFNMPGYSGKFFIREDTTAILIPQSDLKIQLKRKPGVYNTFTYDYLQGFTITAPDGVKFYFGVTPSTTDVDPVEKSTVKTPQNLATYPSVISSWYLYKIESANSEFAITLTYRNEDYSYFSVSTSPCIPDCAGSIRTQKIITNGVALQSIQSTAATVNFVATTVRQDIGTPTLAFEDGANTQVKALDAIQILSTQSSYCTSYKFSFDYFTNNATLPAVPGLFDQITYTTDKKRLKLLSLQQSSCDNSTTVPAYNFSYYDEQLVPRRLSLGQDHWGFYNGAETNTTLVPPVSTDNGTTFSASSDNRESHWPEMRAGTLRIIQYPTGGGAEYVYEPNSVATSGNCTFQSSPSGTTLSAGMGTYQAEFGTSVPLNVTQRSAYRIYITAQGSAGSGKFYIDNTSVGAVNSGTPTFETYIILDPGTYSLKAFANADQVSGTGVLATVYPATYTCDPEVQRIVGGLRVKKIDKFGTHNSPRLSTTYRYENPSLYSIPIYVFKLHNEIFRGYVPGASDNGCYSFNNPTSFLTFRSPVTIQPMESIQGSHIGYGKVTEVMPDGGYTVNYYKSFMKLPGNWFTLEDVCVRTINSGVCLNTDPIYPSPPLPYDFERGNLKQKQVFNNANVKLKQIDYSEQYTENNLGAFGVATGANPGLVTGGSDYQPGSAFPTHFEIKTSKLDWSKETAVDYDENGTFFTSEKVTTFGSAFHSFPTIKTESSNKGVVKSETRYVPDLTQCDYQCPTCAADYRAAAETLYIQYLAKDQTCKPQVCDSNGNNCHIPGCDPNSFIGWPTSVSPCAMTFQCRTASWVDYQNRLNNARIAYTNCIKACTQNNNCIVNGIANANNDEVKSWYVLERANQLNLVESVSWKDDVFQSANYLAYGLINSGSPQNIVLKKVYGTEVGQPVSTFSPVAVTSGIIQRDGKYAAQAMLTYSFNGGQPVEVIDRSGVTTSYVWGFNNTVPVVKAVGVSYSNLNTAYTTSPGTVRNALPNAQVSTYTYDPAIGITTVTDANGRVSYYEYDKLGRLIQIKDHDGKVLTKYQYNYQVH